MRSGADGSGVIRQRVLPDILSIQKGVVWMRDLGVDGSLSPVKRQLHLYAPGGFLDNTWWHRTYWVYGTTMMGAWPGWPMAGSTTPAGRLLVMDGEKLVYGYGRMAYWPGKGHVEPDSRENYRLFAETPPAQPVILKYGEKWWEKKRAIRWRTKLPFVARSIVLTRDALLVAGGKSLDGTADHHGPGTFWVASREDGSRRAGCALPAPPVLDGMAMTGEGVFVSAIDGSLTRLVNAE